jgi:maltodextrin utilization protein YvdJ
MIKHLFLMALILVAVDVSTAAAATSRVNIVIPALAQNVTSENATGQNSTESLTTSKERGAYSEYGG